MREKREAFIYMNLSPCVKRFSQSFLGAVKYL